MPRSRSEAEEVLCGLQKVTSSLMDNLDTVRFIDSDCSTENLAPDKRSTQSHLGKMSKL